MAVKITATYNGDLQCKAVHGPSNDTLLTDAPVDNHGRGEHFSPTDLFATSLLTCMITAMGVAAQTREIDMGPVEGSVEKHMGTQPTRHVEKLVVRIGFKNDHPQKTRDILERAAHTCPVHASLAATTQVDLTITFP
jgi:putative redox protein